jgi:hypothetical protein
MSGFVQFIAVLTWAVIQAYLSEKASKKWGYVSVGFIPIFFNDVSQVNSDQFQPLIETLRSHFIVTYLY